MNVILMNGQRVEVTQEEVGEFITCGLLISNPQWRHSGLLTEEEWARYLKGENTQDELRKVARYILIYEENLAFTAYLFDKAEGNPNQSKEFNMPAVKKLRDIYHKVSVIGHSVKYLSQYVHEMENICLETGADPL